MKDGNMIFEQINTFFELRAKKFALICFCVFSVAVICVGAARSFSEKSADREILNALNGSFENAQIAVQIRGAVNAEGVYDLPRGSRVRDAVDAAGGFSEDADKDSVNLAERLVDGEEIVIPSFGKALKSMDGKVNINTATLHELTSLPGVGDATAQKIISYREKHGAFTSITQLKNIKGLGGKNFDALKDLVSLD